MQTTYALHLSAAPRVFYLNCCQCFLRAGLPVQGSLLLVSQRCGRASAQILFETVCFILSYQLLVLLAV